MVYEKTEIKAFADEDELIEVVDKEGVKHGLYDRTDYHPSTLVVTDRDTGRRKVYKGTPYNMDIDVPQNPILRFNKTDIESRQNREDIIDFSHYIEKNSKDIIEEIVQLGWVLEGVEDIDWSPEIQRAFIDMVIKGLVVDTSIMVPNGDGSILIYTSNDVYNSSNGGFKIDKFRNITEVYLRIPYWNVSNLPAIAKKQEKWFQTQYMKKPNCIIFQPLKNIHSPFGKSYLLKQIQSALEKMYLRDNELIYLHLGGVDRTAIIPKGTDDDNKEIIKRNMNRGIRSKGQVLKVSGRSNMKVDEIAKFETKDMPSLDFDTINSHISSDSPLSKQKIEGEAASGSLGGENTKGNERQDSTITKLYQKILSDLIRDINEVIFGLEKFDIEDKNNGIKVRYPKYDIVFNEPVSNQDVVGDNSDSINDQDGNGDNEITEDNTEGNDLQNELNNDNDIEFGNAIFVKDFVNSDDAFSNAMTDKFIKYEGNMFDAGLYGYPEKGVNKLITPEMINNLASKDIAGRTGYIEIDHQNNVYETNNEEGIGYCIIEGYENGKDKTSFYIRNDIYLNNQHIFKNSIKLSPFFLLKKNLKGDEEIVFLNCAVMDRQKPRSEEYGMQTTAKRV